MSKNPTKAKKHLTVLLMLILIIAVFLLGVSPNNGSAQYALNEGKSYRITRDYAYPNHAVPGTPEFAMSEITRAVREQNGDLFLQYVDLDGILTDFAKRIPAIQAAEVKQQIMAEISSGKAKVPARPDAPVMVLFDDWIVGGVSPYIYEVLSLGRLDFPRENDIAWLNVNVFNARTSSYAEVRFLLRKVGSEYKVLASGTTTANLVSIQNAHASATQRLQRDYSSIRKEWERIIQFEIQAGQARIDQKYRNTDAKKLVAECWSNTSLTQCTYLGGKTNKPSVTILLKNVHDKAIEHIRFKVLFYEMDGKKREYRGQTYAEVSRKNFPLAPGESREIKLELEQTSILTHYYLSRGAYRGEVLPDYITLVGGQRIVDDGSGSLKHPLTMEHKFYLFFFGVFVLVVIIAFVIRQKSNPKNSPQKSPEPRLQGDPAAQPEDSSQAQGESTVQQGTVQPGTLGWQAAIAKSIAYGLAISGGLFVAYVVVILIWAFFALNHW